MFTTLYFKEWKEKARLFFFELGILALLFAGQLVFKEKKDIREWLIYAVLLLFYPFAALVLGAAGFEAEYRQGAWAYLFSRPVGRGKVWLAKFAALASMLAALWLVFVALWAVVPALRELVSGTRVMLDFKAASEFPWWSILASAFLLVVTFSLSLLYERQFNILFLALIIALLLPAAAWAFMNTRAGGFLTWISPERALSNLLAFIGFIALAFAGASFMTLTRSDFSQPRKLTFGFGRWFAMFLVLALAGTAAWALLVPPPGKARVFAVGRLGEDVFFDAGSNILKYSASSDRIRRLARGQGYGFSWMTTGGGKIVFGAYDIKRIRDVAEEVWVMNLDGRGRTKLVGQGAPGDAWPENESLDDLLLSADGAKVAILSTSYRSTRKPQRHLRLFSTDGSGAKVLLDDPNIFGIPRSESYVHMMAWARGGEAILLYRRGYRTKGAYVYPEGEEAGLWVYDFKDRSVRLLLANGVPAAWTSALSPRGDVMVVRYRPTPDGPVKLALLNLANLTLTDIADTGDEKGGELVWTGGSWDSKGERFAGIVRRAQPGGPFVYVMNVYSLAAGKVVAEREMTKTEAVAQHYSPNWTADGAGLVIVDVEAKALRVLGPDLRDLERIDLPGEITQPAGGMVVGDKALLEDYGDDSLWRCDLKTKRWKRIY